MFMYIIFEEDVTVCFVLGKEKTVLFAKKHLLIKSYKEQTFQINSLKTSNV